ncbi:ubiquinol-cytochrome c reductase iron-sulfur subunit [Microaerobacter geothermalis]|uniref:QcrA and Rieske domain-containing protein n=1 Tax=Microaerobacter geothermalis TaxID=674972 RepID=UPI001F262A7A|nr:ubiquinol-cytochrome c reductase iron-sulfur subunit [Microaerobacter geothermalis]MCF6093363.1 ubiquinol-cytochrome c reductase iron-sulfur subunit [Microaerobacter geothermalis]
MSEKEKDQSVSRRQFLTYTLTGVGGFLAAGMLVPMVRFAVDPALKAGAETDKVAVGSIDQFNEEWKTIQFKVKEKDGWYESEEVKSAFVRVRGEDDIMVLSTICTHLGCQVSWNTNPDPAKKNEFFCPCHFGRYTEDGINIAGTPPRAPLWQFEHEVKDGKLYVGKAYPREGV